MTEGKLTKEELREDPVISALVRFGHEIKSKATTIAIVLAVLAVALVVYQVMERSRARGEQQAAVVLLDGENQYQSGNVAEALRRFQDAANGHKGTPSGNLAALRAADCQLELGQFEEARRLYQRFLDSTPKDGLLKASALRGLAGVLESTGAREEAARRFVEAAGIAESPLRPDDLVSAGNALMDAGKLAEAKETFQKVLEQFPESPRVREAKEGIESARARLGS